MFRLFFNKLYCADLTALISFFYCSAFQILMIQLLWFVGPLIFLRIRWGTGTYGTETKPGISNKKINRRGRLQRVAYRSWAVLNFFSPKFVLLIVLARTIYNDCETSLNQCGIKRSSFDATVFP